ncbi:arginine--tRNA ligase [Candidatus Falkowbacteria bacterium HGW-Falkowbacteria-1]|uniref:Arginine--tRNA ligase n=1 Tax=Candidatus Falkowbacteria bacterium HGW-Falkowbacteria-1 TaxID=2013768 RepID=A0A2N2E9Y1_9BACT|nr:MAG: arginine--tRNA ligase [Candidatus Falkowbacteria bacterium HGW-Falkowbacteria-1]
MILKEIKQLIGKKLKINIDIFAYPPNSEMGDISLPLFSLSKERKINVQELANDFREKILNDNELNFIFEKIEASGPYLNFFLDKKFLFNETISYVLNNKNDLGYNQDGQNQKIIFEYSNANTHKEIHIGHLRNIVFGDSLVKISKANGFDSYPVSFINDLGINTAKTVWAYKQNYSQNIGQCYAWSVSEIDKNPDLKEEISQIMIEIEKEDGENYDLWKKTRDLSMKEFEDIYSLLDINFYKTYFESDFTKRGVEIVDDFLKKGIFKKSQGAIIADLEEYGLGVLPVVRSDGTSLYAVADLALAEKKDQDFPDLKKSFIVVDVRQSLHFKQLFKILELAGYKNDFTHLAYDFVKLPEGMMSSRSGKVVLLKDLFDQIFDKLILESKKRHEDWDDKKIKNNCQKLAVAILKFEMLKVGANKTITFNIEEALRFDGYSALYILYTLVRMKSILRKADFAESVEYSLDLLQSDIEKKIALEMAKYSDIVYKTGQDNDPSEIAKYLFDFAKLFNDYYQKINILQTEDNLKKARLIFIYSCSLLLENALKLLGIESLEEI